MSVKRKRAEKNNEASQNSRKRKKDVVTYSAGTSTDGDLQHAVLSCYYPRVVTLRTFLLSKLPESRHTRLANATLTSDKQDTQDDFLDRTLVGILNETSDRVEKTRRQDFVAFTQDSRRSKASSAGSTPEQDIAEIVDYAIWKLFDEQTSSTFRPKHILCHGYQRAIHQWNKSRTPAAASKIPGLILEQLNENVQSLQQAPWPAILALLGRHGASTMRSLLLDCAIFLRLSAGRDNYYQLSGVPVSDLSLRNKVPEQVIHQGHCKVRRQASTASDVVFARHQILYGEPSMNSKGDVRFGMKRNHILNRFPDSEDMEQTIPVMEYVFPHQFDLHNVFTSGLNSKTPNQGIKGYASRYVEISGLRKTSLGALATSSTAMKVPKRLRGLAQDLVRKIQRNNARCPYAQLLRHYTSQALIAEVKAEMPNLYQSAPSMKTQITGSMPSETMKSTSSIKQAARASQGPVMRYATPLAQVSGFCQAVLQHLLPSDAFGTGSDGEANRDVVMGKVDHFIKMRRNELQNLHVIVQGIKISAIKWLSPPKLASLKMSTSDRNKRWEIFNEFVYFVFASLLIPLLRSNFYVTESAVHRSRLFYFRHDVWRKIHEPSLAQLKLTMLEAAPRWAGQPNQPIRAKSTVQTLGHSTIRLLPKLNGIRIIANLKKKALKTFKGRTMLSKGINKQLEPVFDVLNYERSQQPIRLGSSIFSSNEIHPKLKEFKKSVDGQKLYFVKLDIRSCFDSIPQDGLVKLAETLLQENEYRIHTYAEIKGGEVAKMSRKFQRKASNIEENALFSVDIAADLAPDRKRTIFTDTGNSKIQKMQPLLNMLREHITSNTVKIGKKTYRQKNGIPQGSILSSLLCSFFYGAFEAENLSFLDKRSLLVRLIDDFLLITTEPAAARRFLDVMASGDAKYGIAVQASKSLTNFSATVNGRKIPRLHGTTAFPYIGLTIDTRTLYAAKERAAKDPEVRNGLTVQSKQAGRAFRTKVLHSMKIQMLGIVLDTKLNSKIHVLSSLYQCFTEMAMKMCRYADAMTTRPGPALVITTLEESVRLAFNLMKQQSTLRNKTDYQCDVNRLQTEWVASAAVEAVLGKKQSRYERVLSWVSKQKKVAETAIKLDQKTQKLIIEEGSHGFKNYTF